MDRNAFWRKDYKNNNGFGLVNIVIILGIICVLTIVLLQINPIMILQKNRDNQRKNDLVRIQKVLQEFYKENEKYPASNDKYEIVSVEADNPDKPWGSFWSRYNFTLPKDPDRVRSYRYISKGRDQSYYLYASLEFPNKDSEACNKGLACSSLPQGILCGNMEIDVCNYGVSSPNVSP